MSKILTSRIANTNNDMIKTNSDGIAKPNLNNTQEINEDLLLCIAKLAITFPCGTYYGTGFLYGTNVMATAGHCIYDPRYGGMANHIHAIFSDGTIATVSSQNKMHVPDEWAEATTSTMESLWRYDYGVLKLNTTPGKTLGFLDPWIVSNSQLDGIAITVAGYPAMSNQLLDNSGIVTDYGIDDIYFNCSFVSGQSGGPVIEHKNSRFIAIANYAADSTHNDPSGARITFDVADFLNLY